MAKESEESGPSLGGSLTLAIVSALIGAMLAAVNLAFLPISLVKELPPEEERDPKVVYYIAGEEKGGTTWKTKKAIIEKARKGGIAISEGELNRWARTSFKPDPKAGKSESIMGKVKMVPATPNFRIVDDRLQISSQIGIPILSASKKFLFQAKGSLSNDSGVYQFEAQSGYIGACPIPEFGGMPKLLFNLAAKSFTISEEYEKLYPAWIQLSDATLERGKLKLVFP